MKKLIYLPLFMIAAISCSPVNSPKSAQPAVTQSSHVKMVYIAKSSGNPYFDQIVSGFERAAKEYGFDYSTQSPASADATSQIEIIKDQVQRGVNVIAISPNSPDALNRALDEARQKGVVVVCVDDDMVGNESHRDAAVLPCSINTVGDSQIALMAKHMHNKGDFAILSATTDAPNQNAWIARIKQDLTQPQYQGMKLVKIAYGNDEPQKSATETQSLLANYPHLGGILSPTSVGLAAAAQVIENQGDYVGGPRASGGGIALTGLSTPNQLKKAVSNGVVTSFQLWDPSLSGYLAGYVGFEIKSKGFNIHPGVALRLSNTDQIQVNANNVLYAGPMLTFDKSNIGKYNF